MLGRKSCVIGLMEMSAQRPALTIQTGVLSTFARPIGAPCGAGFLVETMARRACVSLVNRIQCGLETLKGNDDFNRLMVLGKTNRHHRFLVDMLSGYRADGEHGQTDPVITALVIENNRPCSARKRDLYWLLLFHQGWHAQQQKRLPVPGCCKRPAEDGRTRLVGNDLADIAGLLLALEVFVTNQCPVLERLDAAPDLAPLRALWKRNLGGLEKIAVVLFLCSSSDHAAQER